MLGSSGTARFYGISCAEEARRFAHHEVLGGRLEELCRILLEQKNETDPIRIFGHVDATKTRSCMTLFRSVKPDSSCFDEVLRKFFDNKPCTRTLDFLLPFDMSCWEGSVLAGLQPSKKESLAFPPSHEHAMIMSQQEVVVSHGLVTGDTFVHVLSDAKGFCLALFFCFC
jgi:hypothetical protein